jgi:hypothetical protein
VTTFKAEKLEPFRKGGLTRFMVFAIESSCRTPIYRTISHDETRTNNLAEQIAGCEECQRQYLYGEVGPRHTPSSRCEEGGKTNHCKCPACYR